MMVAAQINVHRRAAGSFPTTVHKLGAAIAAASFATNIYFVYLPRYDSY